jgi:hypothetical protein
VYVDTATDCVTHDEAAAIVALCDPNGDGAIDRESL